MQDKNVSVNVGHTFQHQNLREILNNFEVWLTTLHRVELLNFPIVQWRKKLTIFLKMQLQQL